MKTNRFLLRLLAVIDVVFSEKFVLTTYKNDIQKSKTQFDKREFKHRSKA